MVPPSSDEVLILVSMLNFVSEIASQSDLAMLLRIHIVFSALSDTSQQDDELRGVLHGVSRLAFVILGQSPQHQRMVLNHPVSVIHNLLSMLSTCISPNAAKHRDECKIRTL
jgi:hypothetical protein